MAGTCIIVADGARARFITVEEPIEPIVEGGPRLVEHSDLVNPDRDVPAREQFSDKSGRGHTSAANGGAAHGFDDHRDRHEDESVRRFARRVIEATSRFLSEREIRRLLIVAEQRMLGVLRAEADGNQLRGVELSELGQDLSRHALPEIHQILARRELVRAAQPPQGGVYRPRGQAPSFR